MNTPLLDRLDAGEPLKNFSDAECAALASELRGRILETVSANGGHLASNLGDVELTIALHRVFGPEDPLVFDVSHQTYAHKLLTGRGARFGTLRRPGGLSGFSMPAESDRDPFHLGHSSTSVSMALGLARAKTMRGEPGTSVAVIGDGSFTGGLAYEGMNNAGRSGERLVVVLNDNEHSISPNVGGFAMYLARIRSRRSYFRFKDFAERAVSGIPLLGSGLRRAIHALKSAWKRSLYHCTLFENLGFEYLGPVDGHDEKQLERVLARAKALSRPVLVHVKTRKGCGYPPAEQQPSLYHAVGPFSLQEGVRETPKDDFSHAFARILVRLAEKDPRIFALTAAMSEGTGLHDFVCRFPDRCEDVGIAEQHALSYAAGLARGGMIPVFAVYSTFLQRGYDMLVHDIALNRLHAVIAVDRAGLVGADGETHQGVFDVALLTGIPGFDVWSPSCYTQLSGALEAAVAADGPAAVRYPRGGEPSLPESFSVPAELHWFGRGSKTLLLSYGRLVPSLLEAAEKLGADGLVLEKIWPVGPETWERLCGYERIFVFEEVLTAGGIGEHIGAELARRGASARVISTGLPDGFIAQGDIKAQLAAFSLDAAGMIRTVKERL